MRSHRVHLCGTLSGSVQGRPESMQPRAKHLSLLGVLLLAVVGLCACSGESESSPDEATATVESSLSSPSIIAYDTYIRATNLFYSPTCTSKPVLIGLFVNVGSWEVHNFCYATTQNATGIASNFSSFCLFKYPLPIGTAPSSILVRAYNVDADCNYDMSTYTDMHPSNAVIGDGSYLARSKTTVMQGTATQKVVVDRGTGMTYEYYPLRGSDNTLGPGHYENLIHSHFGAALQIAMFDFNSQFMIDDCSGFKYWNPTQAGAACSASGGHQSTQAGGPFGPHVLCDGVLNDSCGHSSSVLGSTYHRLMNWGYSKPPPGVTPFYPGPWNDRDTIYLGETISENTTSWTRYDGFFRNTGVLRNNAVSVVPTLYMNNHWRVIHHPDRTNSHIVHTTIPQNASGDPMQNYNNFDNNNNCEAFDWKWMSAENNFGGVAGRSITLAWFPGPELRADMSSRLSCIQEQAPWDAINVWSASVGTLRSNVDYGFTYVLFPYKYDEIIPFDGQNMSVQEVIGRIQAELTSNPSLKRYVKNGVGHWVTTYPVPPSYALEAPLGYLLRTSAPGTTRLYSCLRGVSDYLLRTDPNCAGFSVVQPEGYLYTRPTPGTTPLFSCRDSASNHFASIFTNCEGQTMDGLLGYIKTAAL